MPNGSAAAMEKRMNIAIVAMLRRESAFVKTENHLRRINELARARGMVETGKLGSMEWDKIGKTLKFSNKQMKEFQSSSTEALQATVAQKKARALMHKNTLRAQKAELNLMRQQNNMAHRFRMEYLGIMFAGMALQRATMRFWKSAAKVYNDAFEETSKLEAQTNKVAAAWAFFQFRLMDVLASSAMFQNAIDMVANFLEAFADLDELTIENLGLTIAGVTILGITGFLTGMTVLAASSLGQAMGMAPPAAILAVLAISAALTLTVKDIVMGDVISALNNAGKTVGLVWMIATKAPYQVTMVLAALVLLDYALEFMPATMEAGKGLLKMILTSAFWGVLAGFFTMNPAVGVGVFVLTLGVQIAFDFRTEEGGISIPDYLLPGFLKKDKGELKMFTVELRDVSVEASEKIKAGQDKVTDALNTTETTMVEMKPGVTDWADHNITEINNITDAVSALNQEIELYKQNVSWIPGGSNVSMIENQTGG